MHTAAAPLRRRHLIRSLAAALWLGLPGLTIAAPLDFAAATAEALTQNPEIAIGRARIAQAEAALTGAEASRWPRLELSFTATRTDDPLNAFGLKLSQARVAEQDFIPDNLNNPAAITNYNTRVELRAPLYTGGQLSAQIAAARAMTRAAQHGDAAARQRLIALVAEAYQGVHSARAYVGVAEQGLDAARETVRVSDRLLKQGVAVKSDLLSARVHLKNAEVGLNAARRLAAGAEDRLRMLLGRAHQDTLELGPPLAASTPTEGEAALIERARRDHPGLAALRSQTDAETAQVSAARGAQRPQLSALARQDWHDDQPGFAASAYTVAGVLSWSAFDAGASRAAIVRAQARRAEVAAQLRQAEAGMVVELRDALRRGDEAATRVAASEAAASEADEALRLTRKRYENGLTTLVDLLGVQTQLDQARADRVAAEHALQLSRIELKRAAGILTPDNL